MYVVLDSVDLRKFALYNATSLCMGLLELPMGDGRATTVRMIYKMLPAVADALQDVEPAIAAVLRDCVTKQERVLLRPDSWLLFSEHETSVLLALELITNALEPEAIPDVALDRASSMAKPARSR